MRGRRCRWLLVGLATMIVAGLLLGGWVLWTTANYALEAEKTLHAYWLVLDLVSVHVERTRGRWPKNWDELAAESPSREPGIWKWPHDREKVQQRIHVNFSLTCADVARMNAENFRAISQSSPNFPPNGGAIGQINELLKLCRRYGPKQ